MRSICMIAGALYLRSKRQFLGRPFVGRTMRSDDGPRAWVYHSPVFLFRRLQYFDVTVRGSMRH